MSDFGARMHGRDDVVDVKARLRSARDPQYWLTLGDGLNIDGERAFASKERSRERDALLARVSAEGFFTTAPLVEDTSLARALAAIAAVERAGWPRVFAFVYDALWEVLRAPALIATLKALLGEGARQLPGVWVHHVSPVAGARGWGPHVDVPGPARRMPDGAPHRLTAWLALTDATLENGCLHAVPAPFAAPLTERFAEAEQASMNDVIRLLHGVRALPVPAGALIGWRLDVLHWGGVSTGEAARPRVSLSFELAHEDAPPSLDELPSFSLADAVGFRHRLSVIGRGLLSYGKAEDREPYAHRFVPLGEELVDEHLG